VSDWAVALIGVGGTLAGTAVGGLIGMLTERARWEREQSARWADERRALYSKVIGECEHVVEEITFGKPLEGRTLGEIIDDLRPVRERLRPLIADLELIGSDEDAVAARALFQAAERFMTAAITDPDAPARPTMDLWTTALTDFRRQARSGLHLPQ
jgi:hypothetical protein